MTEPAWLVRARTYVGIAETKGPHHTPEILALLDAADGKVGDGRTLSGIGDDETPWCSSFICAVLELSSIASPRSAWARSALSWGFGLNGPAVGAIVVFERGPKSGHVGFVVGRDAGGHLMVLGGNQGDMVKVSAFDMQRVLGLRWPQGQPAPAENRFLKLPLLDSDGRISAGEA